MSGASPSVKLFPEKVELGSMASAVLTKVIPGKRGFVGLYRLDPVDESVYDSRIRDLPLNVDSPRFAPVPGTWLEVLEDEEEDDGPLWMKVGLSSNYGRALAGAAARSGMGELVPAYQIRAMLYGLLGVGGL